MHLRPSCLGALPVRARALLCAVGLLAGAPVARAGEPPAPDPIVGTWLVDVAATSKGISEAVALDLDALPPAERAEELLRRETFLRALELVASTDGTFRLGIPREAARATAGAWVATGAGAYQLTLRARFGVPVAGGDAGPFEARCDGAALSYRDRDGSRVSLVRGPVQGGVPAVPPARSDPASTAPAPTAGPAPGVHPTTYVATWELDRDRMIDVALEMARRQLDALEPEKRRLAEAMLLGPKGRDTMARQLEAMEIEIDLRGDGSLRATLGLPGRDVEEAIGVWEETEGRAVLTLTMKDGRPASAEDRKPVEGRLDGAILWLELRGAGPAIPLRKLVR